jgi:hypothetical protein
MERIKGQRRKKEEWINQRCKKLKFVQENNIYSASE